MAHKRKLERMTFTESLNILGIQKYEQRILNSNSHGELMHLEQYFVMAKLFGNMEDFPKVFSEIVELAKEQWKRPESVYQHIAKIILSQIKKRT